jgi:hypothetical protein
MLLIHWLVFPCRLQELKSAAEQAKRSMLPLTEHKQQLQQAQEAAAAAARLQEAEHIAQVWWLTGNRQGCLHEAFASNEL